MIVDRVSAPGRFGPLTDDHLSVGEPCPGCGEPLQAGERPALVNATPASVADEVKQRRGLAHNAQVLVAHEDCAYPD